MDYAERLVISNYDTIATINDNHSIYLVQHRETQKIYIKKIMDIYNPYIYEFLQNHHITGIPRVYHLYEECGKLTVIEEFISGASLQEIINNGGLSIDLIHQLMADLCNILGELHSFAPSIIYRDIKPSNIIITPYHHAILIDFNIAKFFTDKATSDTILLGTKGYAAPEQYGFGSSTPQTDIYALGVVLQELAAALPAPTELFNEVIRKCTQINPADRFADVYALKAELAKLKKYDSDDFPDNASAAWKRFLPPGFRTGTPWKMFAAAIGYLFLFWLSLTMEVKDGNPSWLWIDRILSLLVFLVIVFCGFNYCGIQRYMPLHTNQNRFLRYAGVALSIAVIVLSMFFIVAILV